MPYRKSPAAASPGGNSGAGIVQRLAPPLLLAVATYVLFLLLQLQHPSLIGVDGYFHIQYSRLMWTQGLVREFPWLPFTIYDRNYADDHFLFHLLQIPFTFGDLIVGAKHFSAVVAGLVVGTFLHILRRQKVYGAWIWTTGLLVSSHPFLLRLSLAPTARSIATRPPGWNPPDSDTAGPMDWPRFIPVRLAVWRISASGPDRSACLRGIPDLRRDETMGSPGSLCSRYNRWAAHTPVFPGGNPVPVHLLHADRTRHIRR